MKTKLFTLLLLILSSGFLHGQVCATPDPANKNTYPPVSSAKSTVINYCIDVQFHVIRETNGNNAFVATDTNLIIDELNNAYNTHNISFTNIGTNFINNSAFINIGGEAEAANLVGVDNNANTLNYYIVETLWNTPGGFVAGTAVSIPSNHLIIRNDRTLTAISWHEAGHCLDLYHTHETTFGVENINGNNCAITGDLLCQTPADPRLSINNVNNNCVYTGGNGYNPLTNNIMSYSRQACMDAFTDDQGGRMRQALNQNTILQNIVGTQTITLAGNSLLCSTGSSYTLSGLPNGSNILWSNSGNTVRNSSQGSHPCTFSSSGNGNGWIEALITGPNVCGEITVRRNIWSGKPNANLLYFERMQANTPHSLVSSGINPIVVTGGYLEQDITSYTWDMDVPFSNFAPNGIFIHIPGNNLSGLSTLDISIKATNTCGTSSFSNPTEFTIIGGFSFMISPNPSTETLTIRRKSVATNEVSNLNRSTTNQEKSFFKLYDFSGNPSLEGQIIDLTKIDVSQFKKGMYILKIISGKSEESHRLIIN